MDNKYDEKIIKQMAELVSDITAERERQGISQKQLAELSGVKQSAISRLEGLKALPQLDTLLKLCVPLNLKLAVRAKNINKENDMNFSNTDILKLEVETTSCNLNLTTSRDEDFHLVTDNEDDFTFEKVDGIIKIKQKKRNVLRWLLQFKPIELKVTIPSGFRGDVMLFNHNCSTHLYSVTLGKVTIKNANGALVCEDINASALKLLNGNGKIEVLGASIDQLDGNSGNGRIKLVDVNAGGIARVETGNGRVILKSCTAKSFDLRSSNGAILVSDCEGAVHANACTGRISAKMRGVKADYAIDLSTSFGAIFIGAERYQGRYNVGKGTKLEAFTSLGSVRVSFADTPEGDYADILQDEEEFEAEAEITESDNIIKPSESTDEINPII